MVIVVLSPTLQSASAVTSQEADGNAADDYNKAFLLMKDFPDDKTKEETLQIIKHGWKNEDKELKEFVPQNKEAFEVFRRGIAKHRCDFGVKEETITFETPLPHLAKARHLARLLILEGRLNEYQGDYEKAMQNYLSVRKFANHIGEEKIIISKLVEIAINHIANYALIDYANHFEYIETNAYLLDRLRESRRNRIPISEAFGGEKKACKNSIGSVFKDAFSAAKLDTTEFDPETLEQLKSKGITDHSRMVTEFNKMADQYFGELIEAAEGGDYSKLKELEKRMEAIGEFNEEQFSAKIIEIFAIIKNKDKIDDEAINSMERIYVLVGQKMSEVLLGMLYPAITKAVQHCDIEQVESSVVETKLALNIYRKENGNFPESLDDLVPDILNQKPIDPFNSLPLIYERIDDGYLIYSIGPDLIDDSAKIEWKKGKEKGDIVYRYP